MSVLPLDGHVRHALLEQSRCVTSGVSSFEYVPPQYSTQSLIFSLIWSLKSLVWARTTLLNVFGIVGDKWSSRSLERRSGDTP